MKKSIALLSLAALAISCEGNKIDEKSLDVEKSQKWIAEIVEYKPAPGQFINSSLGSPEAAQSIIGKLGDEVSLGGFGGYIIFKFNHNVKNIDGVDFVIFGNAFEGSSEPGAVMVESDGKWYELKGSEYDKGEEREITYSRPAADNDNVKWVYDNGTQGEITYLDIHNNPYFPKFISGNTLIFKCRKTPDNNRIDVENDKWILDAYESGYVDNYSADYDTTVGGDKDTKGSNKFNIDTAVDKDGKSVILTQISAIKVYNCTNTQSGAIGECSTEIRGAISLSAK